MANGSVSEVPPQADASGLCTYPAASCDADAPGFQCCALRPEASKVLFGLKPQLLNTYANLLVLILPLQIYRICKKRGEQEEESQSAQRPGCGTNCFIIVAISVDVYLMVVIAEMTQQGLSVPVRNAMLAASVFLTPIQEIFQFLEDVVSVKIFAAIGAKDTQGARSVLLIGILGGVVLGSLAAAVVTALCFSSGAAEVLLAPFSLHGDGAGCSLVPRAAEVVEIARPYLLISAWTWPFAFTNMALRGFLIGLREWSSFGLLMIIEQGITLVGMYKFFLPDPSLTTLAVLTFAGSSFATVFMTGALFYRKNIREEYLLPPKKRKPSASTNGSGEAAVVDELGIELGPLGMHREPSRISGASWAELTKEGFQAMAADLAVQIPQTVGVYMAGIDLGIGAMYQVSSLQAALPQYGISWVVGLAFMLRVMGSHLLGARKYEAFEQLNRVAFIFVALLAAVSLATTAPFPRQISFELAAQACEYASEPGCVGIYASIFGDGSGSQATLQGSSFKAFVPALCAVCFYRVFKASLYACQDFRFMARAGMAVLVLVFVPAAVVADRVGASPTAVFVAMYLPPLCLACLFALRIRRNIQKMNAGREGPWSSAAAVSDEEESSDSGSADSGSESDGGR